MLSLSLPIEKLRLVGPSMASRLKRLGIFDVYDLIYYFPFRYDDFSHLKKINELQVGDIATVRGKIELLDNRRSPRKKMILTECFLSDETGSIKAIWFGQPYILKVLKNGDEVYFSGKVTGNLLELFFQNPTYEKVTGDTTHTARLVPIYPLTEGITQKQIRFLIKQALAGVSQIKEWLPEPFKKDYHLTELQDALYAIHFPKDASDLGQSQNRLKFDELLKLHLQNYLLKKDLDNSVASPIKFDEGKTKAIVANLGFALTGAQRKAAWQVLLDMAKAKPMNRLLEGDVGSGKTAVAAIALANAALNNVQSAFLVPTEILASQHFLSLKEILKPLDLNVAILTAKKSGVFNTGDEAPSAITKAKLLKSMTLGEIQVVVGTHALIQEKVAFGNLGLVVIDEQHRFGVEQRKAMREKSSPARPERSRGAGNPKTTPHLLSMTATPIPRTLALTLYGDLDLSVLDELPPNRKKPITQLVAPTGREKAYEFILGKVKEGRQIFVVCPLIEESDKLGVKAATEEYQKLSEEIFPQLAIGLLHGRMNIKQKEKVMNDFTSGKIDILAATPVVEVGVNVPNASVILIESAERFGLAQLHQLRGRVNRAHHQSYCFIFTENNSARLKLLVDCFDGFKLAEEDLRARGSGNLTGNEQSGFFWQLRIASLSDVKLIEETKKASQELVENYPETLKQLDLTNNIHPE